MVVASFVFVSGAGRRHAGEDDGEIVETAETPLEKKSRKKMKAFGDEEQNDTFSDAVEPVELELKALKAKAPEPNMNGPLESPAKRQSFHPDSHGAIRPDPPAAAESRSGVEGNDGDAKVLDEPSASMEPSVEYIRCVEVNNRDANVLEEPPALVEPAVPEAECIRTMEKKQRVFLSLHSSVPTVRADNNCNTVTVQSVKIIAPGNSPNTDGIHVQQSTSVSITSTGIKTGDDCISIGPGTNNLWIEHVACGPGHGISIGSLGKGYVEAGVENVTVKSMVFTGTENGLRIKTWGRPSVGFVRGVVFEHAIMQNVNNPIIIDQNYCPDDIDCPDMNSGVKISDVSYNDIQGSSATQVAVNFDCSKGNPCSGIGLQDIKLTYGNAPAESSCKYADGTAAGLVVPPSCL